MSATDAPLSRGLGRPWQLAVTAAVVVAAVWVLAAHRHTVDAGADRLAVADRAWLLAACAAALATWVPGGDPQGRRGPRARRPAGGLNGWECVQEAFRRSPTRSDTTAGLRGRPVCRRGCPSSPRRQAPCTPPTKRSVRRWSIPKYSPT